MTRSNLLTLFVVSTLLAVVGVLFIDQPISQWVGAHEQSGIWKPIVDVLEYGIGITPWTYGAPVALCIGVIATLLVARWRHHARAWIYLTIVYLLARNLMGWGKTVFGRLRPHQWLHTGGDTFGHIGQGASFPSGHVVVFAGLLLPLAVIVPRTRPLLLVIPFIMLARIAVLAHFVSDVCAGLALTALVAWACMPLRDQAAPTPQAAPGPESVRAAAPRAAPARS